jgi:hypothetical protein
MHVVIADLQVLPERGRHPESLWDVGLVGYSLRDLHVPAGGCLTLNVSERARANLGSKKGASNQPLPNLIAVFVILDEGVEFIRCQCGVNAGKFVQCLRGRIPLPHSRQAELQPRIANTGRRRKQCRRLSDMSLLVEVVLATLANIVDSAANVLLAMDGLELRDVTEHLGAETEIEIVHDSLLPGPTNDLSR